MFQIFSYVELDFCMVNNLKSKLRISRFRKEPSVAIFIMYNSKIADLNFIIKKNHPSCRFRNNRMSKGKLPSEKSPNPSNEFSRLTRNRKQKLKLPSREIMKNSWTYNKLQFHFHLFFFKYMYLNT